jgi:hypothetical protein
MFASVSSASPYPAETTTTIVTVIRHDSAQYGFPRELPPLQISIQSDTIQQFIDELSNLDQNWDGYGALKVTPESRAFAKAFLAFAPESMGSPEITPTSNGTISFEWQSNQGDAYIEIGRTRFSGHIQPRNSSTIFIEGQSATLGQQEIAVIEQLLYAASPSKSFTNSIQITEAAF